jgi:hypothetical protein
LEDRKESENNIKIVGFEVIGLDGILPQNIVLISISALRLVSVNCVVTVGGWKWLRIQ